LHGIVGNSPAIQRVLEEVEMVASSDTTVLIRGESGTGKELVARAVHACSRRRYMPVVVVNCGALSEGILESELFGHERGAFTGAQYQRKGKFEIADGGTLFLDEIGDISLRTQVDLLRVLDEKHITRVGGNTPIPVDFRLVTATNRDIEKMLSEEKFREDLYFRINVFSITIPPLRERREDIPPLFRHFVEKLSRSMNKPIEGVSAEALSRVQGHDWPGNVRELQNAAERAVIVCKGSEIGIDELSIPGVAYRPQVDEKSLSSIERRHILDILGETGWNITHAARVLSIDRVTLYNKIRKYGLKRSGSS
jgi:transcriptional regulator with GAF, ATPase, and Fis domain